MPTCPICQNTASFFHKIKKYSYFICGSCQILFLYPLLKVGEMKKYYQSDFSFKNGLLEEKNLRIRARKIIKKLKNLNCCGRTLLDIGSGYGFFISEAKKMKLRTTGVEPSTTLSNYSNILIHCNDVQNLSFSQFYSQNQGKKYHYITAIHVIEHLIDPKNFLRKISSLLEEEGILYIETPNLESHLFNSEKQNYTFLTPPDHLSIFSRKAIKNMLPRNLQIIKSATYSYSSHLMGIIKNLNVKSQKAKPQVKTQNLKKPLVKSLKYLFFDQSLARIFTPFLNIGGKGSILELYIQKKS